MAKDTDVSIVNADECGALHVIGGQSTTYSWWVGFDDLKPGCVVALLLVGLISLLVVMRLVIPCVRSHC